MKKICLENKGKWLKRIENKVPKSINSLWKEKNERISYFLFVYITY